MSDQFDINKIASLSRLELYDDQESMGQQLRSVLKFIDQLQAVDVQDTAPLSHPIENSQPLRADEVTEHNQRDKLQQGAPDTDSGLYIVPEVIEQ
jgi:aspartyl-tRNA(Asn)/glutamyl-tRNA(Gln) amidotransferase subunit C